MASRSDRIEKEVPKYFIFQFDRIEPIRIGGVYPTCMACSHGTNIPEAVLRCLGTIDDPKRSGKSLATGTTAAPTDTHHRIAYPAVAPQKKIMAVASTIFPPARSAKRDENQATDPKHSRKAQDFDSCIAVAVPCVAFKGFLRPLKEKLRVIAS